jgi:peptide/nickel transport system substrate-binding protein
MRWAGRGSRPRLAISLLTLALLSACAPSRDANSTDNVSPSTPAAPKRITLVMRGDAPGFYNKIVVGVPGSDGLQDLVHVGLAHMSHEGELLPVLAEAAPTTDRGTWQVLADGRMETTWTLRPNARWHDGTPVTSDDLLFTIQVATDRELPAFTDAVFGFLEGVEAPDPRTVVARWKQPFIYADRLFTNAYAHELAMPLPRHLLRDAYAENKSGLLALPYWNTEFIGTGPFKVRQFVPSDHVVVIANDQYVLGRPKIDEIEVKTISDSNAILVNVLSGAAELTLGRTVSLEQALEAQRRGGVKPDIAPFNLQRIWPQFIDPRPAVIGDPRFRQALLYGLNRQELVDTLEAGWTTVPASILPPNETQYRAAEAGVQEYAFDPTRAIQTIQGLGYVRGPDGGFADAAGEKLSVEIRNTAGDDNQTKVLFSVKNYWERIGVGVEPYQISEAQNQDRGYKANRPGFQFSGGPNGLDALATLVSWEAPLPDTRYVGINTARYTSADYDALYLRYVTTIEPPERTRALARILEHVTINLPILPLYYRTEARLIANRIVNVAPRTLESTPAWNVHDWDVL